MKKNNGITLVTLVISIIVLIILASVAINTLINNGIIDKAKTAKQEYQNAQDYEETQIAKYSNEIDSYVSGNREQIMVDKDEYLQLKKDIEKIKNNEVILDIITPANDQCIKVADLPDGFTKENSIIIGGYFLYNGISYQINSADFEAWSTATMIQDNGIYMRVDYSGFGNLAGKLVLKKLN